MADGVLLLDDDKINSARLFDRLGREFDAEWRDTPDDAIIWMKQHPNPKALVLDVMLSPPTTIPIEETNAGLDTGIWLLKQARETVLDRCLAILIITERDHRAVEVGLARIGLPDWTFEIRSKRETPPHYAVYVLKRLIQQVQERLATIVSELERKLVSCPRGRDHFRQYERIVEEILKATLVPPFAELWSQAATLDRHEIRDFVLCDTPAVGFWSTIRHDFDAMHVPCEAKNYNDPIETGEVRQLVERLSNPSIGRFGLLVSRCEPGGSAIIERRNAFDRLGVEILFLDDQHLVEMLRAKGTGRPVEEVIARLRREFEVTH